MLSLKKEKRQGHLSFRSKRMFRIGVHYCQIQSNSQFKNCVISPLGYRHQQNSLTGTWDDHRKGKALK